LETFVADLFLSAATCFQQNVQVIGMDGAEERILAVDMSLADQLD
jgi:hypothetical protein